MDENSTKGEVIKEVRVLIKKETQQQMADRLDVSQAELSYFEKGTRDISKKFMLNFYREHGINLMAYKDDIKAEKKETKKHQIKK